ncbi:transposase [Larkinella sp. GY13]|uniref:transposase n=1 Tax=Larkinella sp. GY13 TaxID=3453720 RepID=UPI003EEE3C13
MGSRHPFERRSEKEKRRIVQEVNQGIIGIRAACRKYGLNRNTLRSWLVLFSLPVTDTVATPEPSPAMPNPQTDQLVTRQVKALTKALAQAELKISTLQTVIEVAENELKIKIRKKSGTKRSKE